MDFAIAAHSRPSTADGYRCRVSSTAASALCLWGVSGAPADEILTAWRLTGPRAGVRWMGGEHTRQTDPTVAALPGNGTASGSTALLLPLLRDQRPELLLPRPGDLRGLPIDQPVLREAALTSGAAVTLPERDVTIVAIDEQWRIWPGAVPQPPLDAPAVRDELDAAVTRAATLFARHELGIDALDARRSVVEYQDRLTFPLPAGTPSRAAALLERAVTLEAILAVAGRDRSAAVTAVEGARVDAALAPLAAVARDARKVAVQLVVRAFSPADDRTGVRDRATARDRTG